MSTYWYRFSDSRFTKKLLFGFVLLALLIGLSVAPAQPVKAAECYYGNYFEEVNRGGEWHWRAVAFITRRPIDTRVVKWSPSGPYSANFWDNSISETYGRAYVYFRWPAHLYPTSFISAGKFSACLR